MALHHLLFPQFKDSTWGYVNVDEEARASGLEGPALIEGIVENHGVDYFYGGYMEDRTYLMRDCYQKHQCAWHLGIDYWVPEGTEVILPIDAVLHHSRFDTDQDGGWGGQAIYHLPDKGLFLIFGHLVQNPFRASKSLKAGHLVGKIADHAHNGGWYPHLHVQLVRPRDPSNVSIGWLESIDGYSHLFESIDTDFPRPDSLLA